MNTITDRITKTPGVCGGNARVRDHRIAVWGLVASRRLGMSDAKLLESSPGIEQADLEAAWDYAVANPLEIEHAIWPNVEAMGNRGGDFQLALIVRAWQLGIPDAFIAEVAETFEPPLATDLRTCRDDYLSRKDDFDRMLAELLPDQLREGLRICDAALCG